jgi:hypothetical protein
MQCYEQNEYIDDVIIQSIQDQYNSNEDTDEEPDPPIRLQEAKKSMETLRLLNNLNVSFQIFFFNKEMREAR